MNMKHLTDNVPVHRNCKIMTDGFVLNISEHSDFLQTRVVISAGKYSCTHSPRKVVHLKPAHKYLSTKLMLNPLWTVCSQAPICRDIHGHTLGSTLASSSEIPQWGFNSKNKTHDVTFPYYFFLF